MQEPDLYLIFTSKLEDLKIEYVITGSVASIVYGEPRLTHDIDIVMEINKVSIGPFINAFPLSEFYCPPDEIIRNEIKRSERGHFNIIHHATGFKADIYLSGKNEFQKWAIKNKKEISYNSKKLYIAPPEYVIIKKLEFYKEGKAEKHIQDIKNIVRNSQQLINIDLLNSFIEKFKLLDEWNLINSITRLHNT